jgi:hypothetical protein
MSWVLRGGKSCVKSEEKMLSRTLPSFLGLVKVRI